MSQTEQPQLTRADFERGLVTPQFVIVARLNWGVAWLRLHLALQLLKLAGRIGGFLDVFVEEVGPVPPVADNSDQPVAISPN